MSRYFSERYATLVPYTPGEQPKDRKFVKLNTNESPFPPSPLAVKMAAEEAGRLQLYSDPECRDLVAQGAATFGVAPDEILFSNGSDEVLNFAFMAFADEKRPAVFPDITYGFYKVFAALNHIPFTEIPLKEDMTIDVNDYINCQKTVFIANPNAPTGIALSAGDIEKIVSSNPDRVVVIDEAYIDFGGESVIPLTKKYDNLLVTGTFSKSRSLAGGRLGFAIGCKELIRDLNTIKYSTNPYNVNRMTMAAGVGALRDAAYFENNRDRIIQNRATLTAGLSALGFTVLPSKANFVFAKNPAITGLALYQKLRERGVLIRHFETPRLKDYNRITVGSEGEITVLLTEIKNILEEQQ